MKKLFISILLPFVLLSCSPNLDMLGMFYGQSPRNDERFEASMLYNEEHGYPVIVFDRDEYHVSFASDFHVDTSTNNLQRWIDLTLMDTLCPVGIMLGDLVNAQGNFPRAAAPFPSKEEEEANNTRFFLTPGNHDLYFGQWNEWLGCFFTSVYYFEVHTPHAKDLYICLDSSDGTLGVKQMNWLKSLLRQKSEEGFRHTVVYTHTHMFMQDGRQGHTSNFPMEETYELTALLEQYGVDWYVSGHAHCQSVTSYKGVKYFITNSMQDPAGQPAYLYATVAEQLQYEYIELPK